MVLRSSGKLRELFPPDGERVALEFEGFAPRDRCNTAT